jgi:hypothetical protein
LPSTPVFADYMCTITMEKIKFLALDIKHNYFCSSSASVDNILNTGLCACCILPYPCFKCDCIR